MAVLKILFLFSLHICAPNSVVCGPTEDYNYSLEDEQNSVNFTHVRAKNLSGNVQLTSLEVLRTEMLNNGFGKVEETTKVTVSVNKHIGTIIENQQQDSLLSEVGTKAPTDGLEPIGLMDVFNDTSGTLPDQTTTEKLITDTPLNSEITEKSQDWVSGDLSLISTVRSERINSVDDERVALIRGLISESEEIENLSTFLEVDEELLNEHEDEKDVEGAIEDDINNILTEYEDNEEEINQNKTETGSQAVRESTTIFTQEKDETVASTFTTEEISSTTQNSEKEIFKQTTIWKKFYLDEETTTGFFTTFSENISTEKLYETTQKEENAVTATDITSQGKETTEFAVAEDFNAMSTAKEEIYMTPTESTTYNFLIAKTENEEIKIAEETEASTPNYENDGGRKFETSRINEESLSTEMFTEEPSENITLLLNKLEETELSTSTTELYTTIFGKNTERNSNITETMEIFTENQTEIVQNQEGNLATTPLYEKELEQLEEIIDNITTTLNKYEEIQVFTYEQQTTQFQQQFDTTTEHEESKRKAEKEKFAMKEAEEDQIKNKIFTKSPEILREGWKNNTEDKLENINEITNEENFDKGHISEKLATEIRGENNAEKKEENINTNEASDDILPTTNFILTTNKTQEVLSTTTEENEDFVSVSTPTNTTETEINGGFLNSLTSGISSFLGTFFDSAEKQFEEKNFGDEDMKNKFEEDKYNDIFNDETEETKEDNKINHFTKLKVKEPYRNYLNQFEEETTTINLNLEDLNSASKSPHLPSKADSLINSPEVPQILIKINDEETKVVIKIITNDSTSYIPSNALVSFPSPNTVNITWKSSSFRNNSLQFVMGNSLRLVIVKDTEIYIHQTLIHENKFDVDTNLITLDDDVQIYFSNRDILGLDQRIKTEFSEMTSGGKNLAEITGGCVGAFLLVAGLAYFITKKLRGEKQNFEPNTAGA
ncbi:interaptin [Tribolium castaneum]|uniref:Uncharacterized protein n=1 Tax=Tribolium castaneum TaxID=7070 RepID=D1ZZH8_TRICA|nr:PREDICTED: interaptin [Tribolium castaneum]EFA02372.2 hypothetical protein TcasGA2_TC008047 [Tribolium castaneum]|eukprot:XP_008192083.1 PREDICTED: interaptin [Tribolium castaneum]